MLAQRGTITIFRAVFDADGDSPGERSATGMHDPTLRGL
jgi:hypothetical protein